MLGDSSKRRKDVLLSNIILRKNLIGFKVKKLYFWMVYFRYIKARTYAQCSWISKWGQQKWRFCLFSAEAGNDDTKGNNSKKKVLGGQILQVCNIYNQYNWGDNALSLIPCKL